MSLVPILITGTHRSGTTWLAQCLDYAPKTHILSEPFSPRNKRFPERVQFSDSWFMAITDEVINENYDEVTFGLAFQYSFRLLLKQMTIKPGMWKFRQIKYFIRRKYYELKRYTLIVKDPNLAFSLNTILKNPVFADYDSKCLIICRHPSAFVTSIMRMSQDKQWEIDLDGWVLNCPDVVSQISEESIKTISSNKNGELFERAALYWLAVQSVLCSNVEKYSLLTVRHEDLSEAPTEEFKKLYNNLGLEFNDSAKDSIEKLCGTQNPRDPQHGEIHTLNRDSRANIFRWKSLLTDQQLKRIGELTSPYSKLIYPEEKYWSK